VLLFTLPSRGLEIVAAFKLEANPHAITAEAMARAREAEELLRTQRGMRRRLE
jgi:hypothetical protein